MQPRKFLTFFAGFSLVSVVLALSLFFIREGSPKYIDQNTPFAVVNNYLAAILREDYQQAYTYLGEWKNKPDLETFTQTVQGKTGYQYCLEFYGYDALEDFSNTDQVSLFIETYQCSDEWEIDWNTYEYTDKPQFSPNEVQLVKINGDWKIERMPLPWWHKNWLP